MDQIEKLVQRPLLYNNVDGVVELSLGFMFLVTALLQWLPIQSPWWHRYAAFVDFLLLITAIHYGVKAIKTHITYPRTGFVEYRKRKSAWVSVLVFSCSIALLATWGTRFAARSHWDIDGSHLGMTTPVALIGLVIVVFYILHIVRAVRWKWAVAAALVICSVAIAMLPAGVVGEVGGGTSAIATLSERSFGAWLLTITLYGAIFLISGGISFWLYLRHTQPAAETEE